MCPTLDVVLKQASCSMMIIVSKSDSVINWQIWIIYVYVQKYLLNKTIKLQYIAGV